MMFVCAKKSRKVPALMPQSIRLLWIRNGVVDEEDYERLAKYEWYVSISHGKPYARRQTQRVKPVGETWMHRMLVNCPTGKVVHHINGNTLDNRKANLHITTREEHKKGAYRP